MAAISQPYTRRRFLRTGSTLIGTLCGAAAVARGEANDRISVRPGAAPTPIHGSDGRTYLAYELRVTAHRDDLQLERVHVFDGSTPLLTYGPDELEGRVMRPELARSVRYGRLIRRETSAVLSVWLAVPNGTRPLTSLRHELHGAIAAAVGEARVTIQKREPIILGQPLRQGLWLAHNGPGDHRAAHWGSMLVHGEEVTVPQRYAIDFMGLDARGRGVRGTLDASSNSDWFGFGADVIAVTDALVSDVRDGIADNPPLFEPPPPSTVELTSVGGNYVVLDIGQNRFVHYVHLQKGSVTVRTGQRVKRGQLLGRLGNSGNTNGAHLHFNVVHGPLLREAEGLPYVFDTVVSRGTTTADAVFGDASTLPGASRNVRRALPLNGAMVEFPQG